MTVFGHKWTEFTYYVSPDNQTYRFENHERFILGEEGYGLPPINYIRQKGPLQHGDTIYDYRLEPRTIQLVLRHNGRNRQDYWNLRANFLNYIRPNRQSYGNFQLGKLIKQLPDNSKRAIDVIIQEGPLFSSQNARWDEHSVSETIRFVAPDPTFYDPTQVSLDWVIDTLEDELIFEFVFPFVFGEDQVNKDLTVTYTGTWLTYPTIALTGPMSGPIVTNETTGEFIRLIYDIDAGETVTIALPFGNKSVTSSLNGNIIGVVTTDSDLATFHIAPDPEAANGVNVLNLYALDGAVGTTCAAIAYYTRYIGI